MHADPNKGFGSAILMIKLKNLPADTEEKDLETALRALSITANRVKVFDEEQTSKRAFVSFLSVNEVGTAAIALDHPEAKFKGQPFVRDVRGTGSNF